eukprot:6212175-Pleurochrysis_carterae.AAC.1
MCEFRCGNRAMALSAYHTADTAPSAVPRLRGICLTKIDLSPFLSSCKAQIMAASECGRHQYGAPLRPWRYERAA